MKKILIVGMTSGIGGVETFIINLLENIDKNKYSIDLLFFQAPNKKFESALKNANHVYYVSSVRHHPVKWFFDILRFYRKHHYQIVHANECSAKTFLYCWPLFFFKKSKLIVHSHNGDDDGKILHYSIRPLQQIVTSDRWSCSNEASRWMFGKKYKNKYDIIEIKNGIDVSKYEFQNKVRKQYQESLKLPENSVVLGSVARLETQKNHQLLINIFNEYLATNPNSILIIAGEGSLKQKLQKQAQDLGIESKIRFMGNRNDVPQLLQVFDVLVMPSLYEGMPFIGMEAQAAGLPLVVSNTVDHALNITGKVQFVDLQANYDEWVHMIEQSIQKNKLRNDSEIVRSAFLRSGYLLSETIKQVEQRYSEI